MKITADKIKFLSIVFISTALLLFSSGCGKKEVKQEVKQVKKVQVISIERGTMPVTVGFTGNLYTEKEVSVVPREGGQVEEIFVEEGDTVYEGQVLMRLNTDKLNAQKEALLAQVDALRKQQQQSILNRELQESSISVGINQADQSLLQAQTNSAEVEMRMKQAKIDLDRQQKLFEKGAVSQQALENAELLYNTYVKQYDNSQSMIKNANEAVKLANANSLQKDITSQTIESIDAQINQILSNISLIEISINDCEVKAPFSGVITYKDKTVNKGSIVVASASVPVFKIIDNSQLYLEGGIGEGKMELIKEGNKVNLVLDAYPEKQFEGTVDTIVPQVDSTKMTFKVKVKVDNSSGELQQGMYTRAEIEVDNPEGFIVPADSIIKQAIILGTPEQAEDGQFKSLDEIHRGDIYKLFILKDGKTVAKNVIVVAVNQDKALISKGVTEKDEISEHDKLIITSVKTLQNDEDVEETDNGPSSVSKDEVKTDEDKKDETDKSQDTDLPNNDLTTEEGK